MTKNTHCSFSFKSTLINLSQIGYLACKLGAQQMGPQKAENASSWANQTAEFLAGGQYLKARGKDIRNAWIERALQAIEDLGPTAGLQQLASELEVACLIVQGKQNLEDLPHPGQDLIEAAILSSSNRRLSTTQLIFRLTERSEERKNVLPTHPVRERGAS